MSVSETTSLVPERVLEAGPRWDETMPIRAELCGPEHLGERAKVLAAAKWQTRMAARPLLLRRLQDNGRFLDAAHRQIAAAIGAQEPLSPEAEWLLDNYYIIAGVLRQVRHDLPRGFYAELPVLTSGPLASWPRIWDLAMTLIAHTDSILEESQILRFIKAYQEVAPLTIGELWAIPTMLRLALVENLRHLAGQMLTARADRLAASAWSEHAARGDAVRPLPALPRDSFLVALQQALHDHATTSKTLTD
jgi:cyclic beta-1,2-glucan synthetase